MNDLAGLLHLCKKAGDLILGQKAVLGQVKAGKEMTVLVTSDIGQALKKKLIKLELEYLDWSSDRLGEVFGREKLAVVGITNRSLAMRIKQLLHSPGNDKNDRADSAIPGLR